MTKDEQRKRSMAAHPAGKQRFPRSNVRVVPKALWLVPSVLPKREALG
jgi:hypothetical protein